MNQNHEAWGIVEKLRVELIGYCYRMMGSIFEAEDVVQDTMMLAWKNWDGLREETSRKAWIYRIATNVCLDKLRHAKRRALPMDLSDPAGFIAEPKDSLPRTAWVWPAPDFAGDPADIALSRESIRLSFIAMLQTLPPRQRAVLILHEVFRWSAKETAEAMGMTTTAVNSALQRSRATLAQAKLRSDSLRELDAEADQRLLASYVEAFENYDIDQLLALFHENGSLSMPPFVMWVCGKMNMASFYDTTRSHCAGSRLMPVRANGNSPAYAQYVPIGPDGGLRPWSIHLLEIQNGKIAHIHQFVDTGLFARFGLPDKVEHGRKDFTANR
ncbi:sigma-70 family RNA polymerase sigma factor [Brevibacillus fluminis]|uniref:sigma-70 family RNA polymerase sigma factor n=1 Tax=Brevibacillus fluminis TaxID=511487 RepID=UPI003F8C0053